MQRRGPLATHPPPCAAVNPSICVRSLYPCLPVSRSLSPVSVSPSLPFPRAHIVQHVIRRQALARQCVAAPAAAYGREEDVHRHAGDAPILPAGDRLALAVERRAARLPEKTRRVEPFPVRLTYIRSVPNDLWSLS